MKSLYQATENSVSEERNRNVMKLLLVLIKIECRMDRSALAVLYEADATLNSFASVTVEWKGKHGESAFCEPARSHLRGASNGRGRNNLENREPVYVLRVLVVQSR